MVKERIYRFKPGSKRMQMREYFGLINSDCLHWQTTMFVSTEPMALSELVEISNVSSLVFLGVTTPHPGRPRNFDDRPISTVTDRVIKSWSERARAGKGFRYLRDMVLDRQSELTHNIFSYLDAFPALSVLVLSGCPHIDEEGILKAGAQYGWQASSLDPQYYSFESLKAGHIGKRGPKSLLDRFGSETTHDRLPTLYFHLGNTSLNSLSDQPDIYLFYRKPGSPSGKQEFTEKAANVLGADPPSRTGKSIRTLKVKASKEQDIVGLLAGFN
ncbi:predicted protein [Uncinocarpus reesii 1704]|uniref:Uncharacterized protein n=1 Tax=Uncinocarpus reesii (strain UAMH 1704) TaxID=336963 RepID=C4JK10_UNCRE|nr:uncharacterized protein UREG_01967 [Uncinocarpus reesii 1704]EEP77118.1 predicted protein [Uncinocarpus reesii 1704]